MSVAEQIRQKLTDAFAPEGLEVVDQSHLHAGHVAAPEGGESHFRVVMVSGAFEGQSRLQRQRAVNAVLKAELAGPVHALALSLSSPSEG